MVYFVTIGQLYIRQPVSLLFLPLFDHSEMRKSVGNSEETTLFFHYNYQTKTCNHSVVKTTNLFLQCMGPNHPQIGPLINNLYLLHLLLFLLLMFCLLQSQLLSISMLYINAL